MIVKMDKYTFVVMASAKDAFLERLQELGMVDVTVSGWEPTEDERNLVGLIERYRAAAEYLRPVAAAAVGETANGAASVAVEPFGSGAEAFAEYEKARAGIATAEGEIARYGKLLDETAPLGEIDPAWVRELESHGVALESLLEAAGLDADTKLPDESPAEMRTRVTALEAEREEHEQTLARAAASLASIEAEGCRLQDTLQFRRTKRSGTVEAAEGSLAVMEAWARRRDAAEVERMLERNPAVFHLRENPTPDDETPVELHNNRVVRPFEFIAEMYALPRYGTMDLTRWFAPFYMLFFAFCLADAGYGLLLFAGGSFLALRSKGAMQAIGKLSMWCGGAAVVFGFLAGSLFGIDIKPWFGGAKVFFPDDDMFLFALALCLGVAQILFGMVLKAITTARYFGIKYTLATIGWIIVIVAGGALVGQSQGVAIPVPAAALQVALCAGVFMMLFLNNPGKNPLVNLGGGLWNTYNDVTGFLSDALSYIRLFAIGLSGGVLATVFNDLAFGMSPDIPVLGQLVTLIILLIGHGLNLFMSTLSSMVHPLRLTFVEFYKNAGFEASGRTFDPLRKSAGGTDK